MAPVGDTWASLYSGFWQSLYSRHLCLLLPSSPSSKLPLLTTAFYYDVCFDETSVQILHVDEMFLLNDALQPFQVSQGQASHNSSWFHYANRPVLLHSRRFVCMCVCVRDNTYPHSFTPALPPHLHFDHSLFSFHRANWVCACVTHSRLRLIISLYNLTDRWVFLWLTHSLKQTRKCQHGCTHTHITRSRWVTKLIASTRLYVCVAVYWPVHRRMVSKEALKMTGTLLTQMLVVRVCGFSTHPSASDKQGFSDTVMLWERKCILPQTGHSQLSGKNVHVLLAI